MISGLVRGVFKLARGIAGAARHLGVTLGYPQVQLGRDVIIGPGVTLKATDGGRIQIGDRVAISSGAVIIAKGGLLIIGSDGFVGEGAVIAARERLEIGPDALIAEYVTIRDQDHGFADLARPMRLQGFVTAPVIIGANVWLGAKATVLKGVTIEDGAVIGANSVVTRSLGAGVVAVGCPARVIANRASTAGISERDHG